MRTLELANEERDRQEHSLQLIASENLPTPAVLRIQAQQMLAHKTAEGRPGARLYGGCEIVDEIERSAIESARTLFGARYANVQTHTASDANRAAVRLLSRPGDTVLALAPESGGHFCEALYDRRTIGYNVDPESHEVDLALLRNLAKRERPQLIVVGGSALPQECPYVEIARIAEEVGAQVLVDMAHTSGLVAGGVHSNPLPYCAIATLSTYKTMRGPRSGALLVGGKCTSSNEEIDSAVFPGSQGSPNMLTVAAKQVCFEESLGSTFQVYASSVRSNASSLARALIGRGLRVASGGTSTHVVLVDVSAQGLDGVAAEASLAAVGVIANRCRLPVDRGRGGVHSGLRLGTAFLTSRGFQQQDFEMMGEIIASVLVSNDTGKAARDVALLASTHPLPI